VIAKAKYGGIEKFTGRDRQPTAGASLHRLQNIDGCDEAYLNWQTSNPPIAISLLAEGQFDILFSRDNI
jgi:hypothetical protein